MIEIEIIDRVSGALQILGKGRSSFYADIKSGLMTPPVPLGLRAVGWPRSELGAINAARIAGKSEEQIRQLVATLVAARRAAA